MEHKGWSEKVYQEYHEKVNDAYAAGGEEKRQIQYHKGKRTARERMELLFDEGKFQELDLLSKSCIADACVVKKHFFGDGVISGYGKVNGQNVFAISQDATISGGAGGEEHINKICRTLEKAIDVQVPFVMLNDSGGARIEEGISSLAAYSRLFYLTTRASGLIPQIAAIMGNCAGGSSYSPAMNDFLFMVEKTSQMYITGPQVIRELTGEEISMEQLGGAYLHSQINGQAGFVYQNDEDCILGIRKLLAYLPQNCNSRLEALKGKWEDNSNKIEKIVPENKRKAYDVKEVIDSIVDNASFMEVFEGFATNIVIGYARINGRTVGIVANQPNSMGGALDCDAADKAARFIRCSDAFNIPIVTFVDVPAFYPGYEQEKKGILRHGSKLLYAYSEAVVPKISIIMRKAYGGAYCAMNSKTMGADFVYAWPICEIAVMGAEGAVNMLHKREIRNAEDGCAKREELIKQYEKQFLNPYFAASKALIDEIILPEETKEKITMALEVLTNKEVIGIKKKHGNIPL